MNIVLHDLKKAATNGLVLNLTKSGESINRVRAVLSWGAPRTGAVADLDLVIVAHQENNVRQQDDVACYATSLTIPGISILKDVTSGNGDAEEAIVTFDATKQTVNEISVWATVFTLSPSKRDHTFGNIGNGLVTLINEDTGETLAQYSLDSYGDTDTMRIGDFYYADGKWKFRPVAQAGKLGDNKLPVIFQELGF